MIRNSEERFYLALVVVGVPGRMTGLFVSLREEVAMDDELLERLPAVGAMEGHAYWFLGTLVTIKASGNHTGGTFALIEQLAPPGFGPPLHVHHREDETFYVLEGRVRFRYGSEEFFAEGGGCVFLPKGIPHTFRVEGTKPAKLLQMTLPSGFDRFVEEMGVAAPSRTLPPPGPPSADLIDRLVALGSKYGFSVIGPPLEPI